MNELYQTLKKYNVFRTGQRAKLLQGTSLLHAKRGFINGLIYEWNNHC